MKLEVVSVGEAGRTFTFAPGTDVTIGREESCGVCLLDHKVSNGGTVSVDSTVNVGTEVTILLPEHAPDGTRGDA